MVDDFQEREPGKKVIGLAISGKLGKYDLVTASGKPSTCGHVLRVLLETQQRLYEILPFFNFTFCLFQIFVASASR